MDYYKKYIFFAEVSFWEKATREKKKKKTLLYYWNVTLDYCNKQIFAVDDVKVFFF